MIHPNYEILDSNKKNHLPNTLTPVYPTTQGLAQGKLRSLISQALNNRLDNIEDLLPTKIASELGLGSLKQALKETHCPKKRIPRSGNAFASKKEIGYRGVDRKSNWHEKNKKGLKKSVCDTA